MEERYYATGRRKTSVARVWLTQGNGKVTVNRREVKDYFSEMQILHSLQPLRSLGVGTDFDIWCTVKGGVISGQAGALRHGIARAIEKLDGTQRTVLKRAGYLTRDPRKKERKKYGQKGARARFQFSKR